MSYLWWKTTSFRIVPHNKRLNGIYSTIFLIDQKQAQRTFLKWFQFNSPASCAAKNG